MEAEESPDTGLLRRPEGGASCGAGATALGVLGWIWSHPANKGRRARQILHAVRFQVGGRLFGRTMRTPLGEGSQLFASIGDTAASAVVYANPPDYDEMQFWSAFLRPGDLFVDVGANVGSYTVWACQGDAEVIAVEPHPLFREKLEANLRLNGYRATVVADAIGSAEGTIDFTANLGTTNHVVTDSGGGEAEETFEVAVRCLDQLLSGRHVRGVKVDVEGYERAVVEGAAALLADHRIDVLQLEWNSLSTQVLGEDREPLRSLLVEYGYELIRPDGTPVDGSYGKDVFAVSPAESAQAGRALLVGGVDISARIR